MVDTVDTNSIFTGTRKITRKFTNISDGTGETSVVKVDISGLTGPNGVGAPTYTSIEKIEGNVQGFTSVRLHWDHTTDDEIAILGTGCYYGDWRDEGCLVDPRSTGGTGDILLTTAGAAAGATYDITMTIRLMA